MAPSFSILGVLGVDDTKALSSLASFLKTFDNTSKIVIDKARAIDESLNKLPSTLAKIALVAQGVSGAFKGMASVIQNSALNDMANTVMRATKELGGFRRQLIGITGSTEKAKIEWEKLVEAAEKSPFHLDEYAKARIEMERMAKQFDTNRSATQALDTAQKLAIRNNVSLAQAVNMVGRAYMGQQGSMRRLERTMKITDSTLLKKGAMADKRTGRVMEGGKQATNANASALEKFVGEGVDTTKEKMVSLDVAMGHMHDQFTLFFDAIGQKVTPVIVVVAEKIGEWAKSLRDMDPAIVQVVAGVLGFAGAAATIMGILAPVVYTLSTFTAYAASAGAVFASLGTAIAGLAFGEVVVAVGAAVVVFEALHLAVKAAFEYFGVEIPSVTSMLKIAATGWSSFFGDVKNLAGDVVTQIGHVINKIKELAGLRDSLKNPESYSGEDGEWRRMAETNKPGSTSHGWFGAGLRPINKEVQRADNIHTQVESNPEVVAAREEVKKQTTNMKAHDPQFGVFGRENYKPNVPQNDLDVYKKSNTDLAAVLGRVQANIEKIIDTKNPNAASPKSITGEWGGAKNVEMANRTEKEVAEDDYNDSKSGYEYKTALSGDKSQNIPFIKKSADYGQTVPLVSGSPILNPVTGKPSGQYSDNDETHRIRSNITGDAHDVMQRLGRGDIDAKEAMKEIVKLKREAIVTDDLATGRAKQIKDLANQELNLRRQVVAENEKELDQKENLLKAQGKLTPKDELEFIKQKIALLNPGNEKDKDKVDKLLTQQAGIIKKRQDMARDDANVIIGITQGETDMKLKELEKFKEEQIRAGHDSAALEQILSNKKKQIWLEEKKARMDALSEIQGMEMQLSQKKMTNEQQIVSFAKARGNWHAANIIEREQNQRSTKDKIKSVDKDVSDKVRAEDDKIAKSNLTEGVPAYRPEAFFKDMKTGVITNDEAENSKDGSLSATRKKGVSGSNAAAFREAGERKRLIRATGQTEKSGITETGKEKDTELGMEVEKKLRDESIKGLELRIKWQKQLLDTELAGLARNGASAQQVANAQARNLQDRIEMEKQSLDLKEKAALVDKDGADADLVRADFKQQKIIQGQDTVKNMMAVYDQQKATEKKEQDDRDKPISMPTIYKSLDEANAASQAESKSASDSWHARSDADERKQKESGLKARYGLTDSDIQAAGKITDSEGKKLDLTKIDPLKMKSIRKQIDAQKAHDAAGGGLRVHGTATLTVNLKYPGGGTQTSKADIGMAKVAGEAKTSKP